jgi:hypothetical protein
VVGVNTQLLYLDAHIALLLAGSSKLPKYTKELLFIIGFCLNQYQGESPPLPATASA